MRTYLISIYNRYMGGFNSSGPSDPTDTIFRVEMKGSDELIDARLSGLYTYARFIADAETGVIWYRKPLQTMNIVIKDGERIKTPLFKTMTEAAKPKTFDQVILHLLMKGH